MSNNEHRTSNIEHRTGQIRASILFALTLAILVGLVLATVFVKFVWPMLAPKPALAQTPALKELTVAAFSLPDKHRIHPNEVKVIKLSAADYQAKVESARCLRPGRNETKGPAHEQPGNRAYDQGADFCR